ncbi:FecR family protein [Pedobacter gandavensis]|uniref:DUF4974 domain-containing protein n=1 Tax=Pedobacter gandavensis TaxID=2679963 RepID=A0ABR6EVG0_9SPHI|nr:FecR family protein [Pedobacter gandavensis]MBB2149258.1 DUF4974 domain-containing protein [Pedobacter gandavensis]
MQKEEVADLLKKYLAGNCSAQERGLLETWYLKYEEAELPEFPQEKKDLQLEEIWGFLADQLDLPPVIERDVKSTLLWQKIAVAAMVLITLSLGYYFYNFQDKVISDVQQKTVHQEQSFNNKATLTLADGRVISLDEAKNGEIAKEDGITITKTKDGQLVYEGKSKLDALNNISTPKGGQYQINLPDGTKVWLNAVSSLSYPAAFNGDKRTVKLIGEAYFEVAKNKKMPFVVSTNGQEVMVLGTHFNVNAYGDESQTKTTLLEGAVKVKLDNSEVTAVLKPGQQTIFKANQLEITPVDVEEAIAWKDGYFLFQDEDIRSIMRKIARWYDVDVVYDRNVSPKEIGGRISRHKSLNEVLKMLSNTDKFNFKVEGRRVTVMP